MAYWVMTMIMMVVMLMIMMTVVIVLTTRLKFIAVDKDDNKDYDCNID